MRTYAARAREVAAPGAAAKPVRAHSAARPFLNAPSQPTLLIGAVDHPAEREADRVADQVIQVPGRKVSVAPAPLQISRRCAACDTEEKLRREPARTGEGSLGEAPGSVHEALRSGGQPLDPATRAYFEPRFGHDFSRVRVHACDLAGQSARDVNARAYTVGHNIVFDAGRFAPGTQEGRHLLAHELTHVVQQTAARSSPRPMLQRQPKDQPKNQPKESEGKDKPTLNFVGCDDRKTELEDAVSQAKALASRAIAAFEREFPLTFESTAMDANFGKSLTRDQKNTIIERYKHIRDNLETKTYTCSKQPNKKNQKKRCAEGACPGHDITIFPIFGTAVCPDRAAILLHEASHNAGACDDIDVGANYPPAQSENNAYSYEHFASDVAGGGKEGPNLGKRRPNAP